MVHTSPCVEERAGEWCCLPSRGQYRLPAVAFRQRRDALYRGGPPSAPAARGSLWTHGNASAVWLRLFAPPASSDAFVLQQEVESRVDFAEWKR